MPRKSIPPDKHKIQHIQHIPIGSNCTSILTVQAGLEGCSYIVKELITPPNQKNGNRRAEHARHDTRGHCRAAADRGKVGGEGGQWRWRHLVFLQQVGSFEQRLCLRLPLPVVPPVRPQQGDSRNNKAALELPSPCLQSLAPQPSMQPACDWAPPAQRSCLPRQLRP